MFLGLSSKYRLNGFFLREPKVHAISQMNGRQVCRKRVLSHKAFPILPTVYAPGASKGACSSVVRADDS